MISHSLKTPWISLMMLAAVCGARADSFGSGGNAFEIDFVTVGQAWNAADSTGYGAVTYDYRIGVLEVSAGMIAAANALGALGLTPDTRPADLPATGLSWNQAARFVNWLNTSTGHAPAYKFALQSGQQGYDPDADIEVWASGDDGYNPSNPYRNSNARYFLPSENEWYKAAYFDPATWRYFSYPTGSSSAPTPVSGGTASGTAVYAQHTFNPPAAVGNAGGLSPAGTMGQGGNAEEFTESAFSGNTTNPTSARALRGGMWTSAATFLASTWRGELPPDQPFSTLGFRVASVAEEGTVVLTLQGTADLNSPWQTIPLQPGMINPQGQINLGTPPGNAQFYRMQIQIVQP